MKFVFFGCGSIGQRHIRNLIDLGYSDICAFRTKKGHYKSIPSTLKIKEVYDWADIIDYSPDVAFITNPTSEHIKTAVKIAPYVKGIFIEKPLSNTTKGFKKLEELAIKYQLKTFVGYNLLHHPIIGLVQKKINDGSLGKPIVFQCNVGQWLPDWHPYENYKKAYYARKDLGGGISLTMIHEINLARMLLGPVKDVFAFMPQSEKLDLDVDVIADIMIYHLDNSVSQIHLDCIQKVPNRSGLISFENGWCSYDLIKSRLKFKTKSDEKAQVIFDNPNYNFDEMYKAEQSLFLNKINSSDLKHANDIWEAKKDLDIVEAAHISSLDMNSINFS